jgi:D-amino peptidase
MRVYLSVDLEGINGIVHSSQTQPGEPGYERALCLMHEEANAVMSGLEEAGADAFIVNDAHWDARNLRIEKLHPKASLINGWQKPLSMVCGINDGPIEAACFVGYHAMAGSPCGVLSHTYRAQIYLDVKLNGKSVGETGLNAAMAGYFDVPVILVTGDDIACQEAKELLGEVETIEVKKAVSRYSAVNYPYQETLAKLRSEAKKALVNRKRCRPLKPPSPSTLDITMIDPAMADAAELLPEVKRISAREISITHADYLTLFRLFLSVGVLGASRKDPHF